MKSGESRESFLADGFERIKIAIRENVKRVKLHVREYENDLEAIMAARVFSYKLNKNRGSIVGASLVKMVKDMVEEGWSLDEIADQMKISKRYLYYLLEISRDREVMEKLEKDEISIFKTIELIKSKKNSKEEKHIYDDEENYIYSEIFHRENEGEKAQIELLSARIAKIERAKECKAEIEDISAKEAKREEVKEIPATIKSELEKAFEKLDPVLGYQLEDENVIRKTIFLLAYS